MVLIFIRIKVVCTPNEYVLIEMDMKLTKITACILLFAFSQVQAEDLLQENVAATKQNQMAANKSQEKIDGLYEQERDALQNYRITQAEIEQLNVS
jgi:hypothetical protein